MEARETTVSVNRSYLIYSVQTHCKFISVWCTAATRVTVSTTSKCRMYCIMFYVGKMEDKEERINRSGVSRVVFFVTSLPIDTQM